MRRLRNLWSWQRRRKIRRIRKIRNAAHPASGRTRVQTRRHLVRRGGELVLALGALVGLGHVLFGDAGEAKRPGAWASTVGVSAATPATESAGAAGAGRPVGLPSAPGAKSPRGAGPGQPALAAAVEAARAELPRRAAGGGGGPGGIASPGNAPRGSRATRPPDPISGRRIATLQSAGVLERALVPLELPPVRHVDVAVRKQGLPLLNRVARLHELDAGDGAEPVLLGRTGTLAFPPLDAAGWSGSTLSQVAAIDRARDVAQVVKTRGQTRVEKGWFAEASTTVPAWRVTVASSQPFGTFQVTLDARSGEVLAVVDLVREAQGAGSVYDPNVVLSPAPTTVPLYDLNDSGYLSGTYTRVLDPRAPAALRPDLSFLFAPTDPRFVQTSAYRGLTDTGRLVVARGFPPFAQSVLAYTNLPDPETGTGEFNNAYYDPGIPGAAPGFPPIVPPSFGFGNGDGVLVANLGTDADVAAHEMGHHVFEKLVKPLIFSVRDPILAMNEAVADTFAALTFGDPEIAESVIPGQPPGLQYLRTLESTRSFPDGVSPDPHETGLIYAGANWDLVQAFAAPPATLTDGIATFGSLLIASLPFLPPDAFAYEYRDALRQGDQVAFGGVHLTTIDAVFAARGFDAVSPPEGFGGYLDDGIAQVGTVTETEPTNFRLYLFFELPNSQALSFTLAGPSPGDADMLVYSVADLQANGESAVPYGTPIEGSDEVVSLMPPEVDADDAWLVIVQDRPDAGETDSPYTLVVQQTPPAPTLVIDGPPVASAIDTQGEVDLYTVAGTAGQVVTVSASSVAPTLDPIVAIFELATSRLLAGDDDSGPGSDALIQGVQLPATGIYLVLVLSPLADLDPVVGTGAYQVAIATCSNASTDTDGDGLADACDGDDDADGFIDAGDTDPLSASSCADLDLDGCNDCSGGTPDILSDGPDADADGFCDAGDLDDDNDGCTDAVDPQPFVVSQDPDLDGLGSDCDACANAFDPGQEDHDGDGRGDACDNCRFIANANQKDTGGLRSGSPPDGIGDLCQCGDLSGDGFLTTGDAVLIQRAKLNPPTVQLTQAQLDRCDVGGSAGCTTNDAVVIRRALLNPPTAVPQQICKPAVAPPL